MGELYDMYIDELFAYGIQFSKDKSLVMDAIHDLFLNLYKYRNTIVDTDNVSFYLFRALKNTMLQLEKKQHPFRPIVNDKDEKSEESSIEEQICIQELENERAYKLAKAIAKLSKKQRQALYLRYTEEWSYEDVAAKMGVSVQTSRTIVYRAVKSLRKQI